MSAKFLGPFISTDDEGQQYERSYVNFSHIMTIQSYQGGDADDAEYAAIRTIPHAVPQDNMSLTVFSFYNADSTALVPDVDRGYLRFLNRNLINVLTSRPDDVVVPVDYPIGLQTKNIYVATDYA